MTGRSRADTPSAEDGSKGLELVDSAMERYVDGKLDGFDDIYGATHARVHSYLLSLTRSRDLADDLLQTTYLKLHASRGAWVRGARLLPYLYAIARNAALDELRSLERRKTRPTAPGEMPEGSYLPDEPRLDAELSEAIGQLPDSYQEAIRLTKELDLSAREAGVVLGVTETAIKLRLHRAYKLLRKKLAARESVRLR